ncbi:MAG: acyltransferase family protein [Oscillibacter sp.]|nr:acyltransferase family protein [Oscillibacter sp.]
MAEVKTGRNLGLDLLRMVSMLGVVMLHVLGQQGVLASATPLSLDYMTAWLLECAAFCAVNCYALISGYVGVTGKFRYANLALIWCQAAWYTLLIPVFFALKFPGTVGEWTALRAFFPAMSNHYWYFTAYFGMFFFIPAFNFLVNGMPRRQMRVLAGSIVVVFSILPTVFQTQVLPIFPGDLFFSYDGYSPLWLGLLYILGAYIRKYGLFEKVTCAKALAVYAACVLLTWGEKMAVEWGWTNFGGGYKSSGILVSYTSPTILLAAVALLGFFVKLRVPGWAEKPIGKLSPLSFSVYLIHVHPLVWLHFMTNRLTAYGSYGTVKLAAAVILTALAIYAACTALDVVRAALFGKLRLRERLAGLEERYIGSLWVNE